MILKNRLCALSEITDKTVFLILENYIIPLKMLATKMTESLSKGSPLREVTLTADSTGTYTGRQLMNLHGEGSFTAPLPNHALEQSSRAIHSGGL